MGLAVKMVRTLQRATGMAAAAAQAITAAAAAVAVATRVAVPHLQAVVVVADHHTSSRALRA